MRCYDVCLPEKKEWCVPATLQTVLKKRGINRSQEEIAGGFPEYFEEGNFRGFKFSEELLKQFFKENNLEWECRFLNPFIHFDLYQNVDLFLNRVKDNETIDVLVAYDSKFHKGKTRRGWIDHLAVLMNYSLKSDLVRVTGVGRESYKEIPLPLLIDNIHPDKNENYGFYVVEDE